MKRHANSATHNTKQTTIPMSGFTGTEAERVLALGKSQNALKMGRFEVKMGQKWVKNAFFNNAKMTKILSLAWRKPAYSWSHVILRV